MVPLARQELRIARMLVGGLSQPEIGAELGIATNTVKTYVARIRAKTGYQREEVQLSFEVFLDRLLGDRHPPRFEIGASCAEGVLAHLAHSPELRDAALLMRAGFPDWQLERSYVVDGERRTEWRARDGFQAIVIGGRRLRYRSETLDLAGDISP
ncbi:MAG: LuxR C-terminal-related transcriptional regulator [bacterium]|nr:LuxR C-terminal-related transcriptional regulator [bacterium]